MTKRKLKLSRDVLQSPHYIALLVIAMMIIWVIGSAIIGAVQAKLITKMVIESETQDISWGTYGFLHAPQTLINVDVSGTVTLEVEQDQRAAKNQSVFSVKHEIIDQDRNRRTEEKYFYAPISGIVSYQIDGYEALNSIEEIEALDLKRMYEDHIGRKKQDPKRKVEQGTAYAEVIDNLQPSTIYFRFQPDQNSIFSEIGDVFRIRFPDTGETSIATIKDIIPTDSSEFFCEARLGPMSDQFLQQRVIRVEPYRIEPAKMVLPKSALVYRNDEPGVYTVVNRVVNWRRVTIESETDQAVTCEVLPKGTVVITSPQRVEIGDIVN